MIQKATIDRGGQVTLNFSATVQAGFVGLISNQGTVSGSNFLEEPTDDPNTLSLNDPIEPRHTSSDILDSIRFNDVHSKF